MTWTFVLTDLQGTQLGEITNADNRKVTLPLNRVPTASFTIPNNHYLAPYFFDPSWDGLLKCYRDGVLRFCGPIVTSDDQVGSTDNQTITVNAAGPMWRLGYRLLGNTSAGWSLGNAVTTYDLGFIADQMLAYANSVEYTGITAGSTGTSTNGSAGPFFFKPVDQAIAELTTGAAAFDFDVAPVEPTNVSQPWPKIGTFNCYTLLGSVKNNVVFEFGTSRANLKTYGHTLDRSNIATKGYIQQPAASDHSGILTSSDSAAITARGVFETLVDDGGTEWDSLRQALVDGNVAVRKQARRVLSIFPASNNGPVPFVDYIVGDQVPVIIVVDSKVMLNALLRVWGFTFTIDPQGGEALEIATLPTTA